MQLRTVTPPLAEEMKNPMRKHRSLQKLQVLNELLSLLSL